MSPNQHTNNQTAVQGPTQEEIRALYDNLMREIEPELVTENIQFLDFIYLNEAPEQKEERVQRYAKAFVLLEERMGTLFGIWEGNIQNYKRQALTSAKVKNQQEEGDAIQHLSGQIDNV